MESEEENKPKSNSEENFDLPEKQDSENFNVLQEKNLKKKHEKSKTENTTESIQFSKIYKKDEESLEDNNLLSTRVFLKSIDLRCEDHLQKFQQDVEATRYCKKCQISCCDSCVIDYHISHIEDAKIKVDDYFISQKNLLQELNSKLNNSSKIKINENEINKIVTSQKKIVTDFFSRRKDELDKIKKKINNMLTNENELKEKMTTAIEIFYKDECHKRLNVPIEENSRLEKKMQKFLYDWSTFNKREKVIALKNNTIKNLENEVNNNLLKIKEGLEEFSGKSFSVRFTK